VNGFCWLEIRDHSCEAVEPMRVGGVVFLCFVGIIILNA